MGIGKAAVYPTLAVTDIKKAREFYGKVLGLEEVKTGMEAAGDKDAAFRVGDASFLYLYERPTSSGSTATACSFEVDDVKSAVKSLRDQGVRFEEYDIPEMNLKTVNGIAEMEGGYATAWFKDPSGNILAIGNALSAFTNLQRPMQKSAEAATEVHVH